VADIKTEHPPICMGRTDKYGKSLSISSVLLSGLEQGTSRIQVRSFADRTSVPYPVFPFARGHFLASTNNHGYSHPDFIQVRIYADSMRNNAMYDLTLIHLIFARFVGTGCFLIRYTNDQTE